MTIGRPPKIFQAGSNKGESSATFHAESQSLNLGRRIEFLFTGCYLSRSLLRPIENARQRLCKSHSAPGATSLSEGNGLPHFFSPATNISLLPATSPNEGGRDEKINLLLGRRGILSFSDHQPTQQSEVIYEQV